MRRSSLLLAIALAAACRMDNGLSAQPPNEAPTAPSVVIQPAEPTTIDDLLAVITEQAVDPEGDAITYQLAWTVDQAPTDLTTEDVPADRTAVDQVWTVELWAFDGEDAGPSATASVTILNTPPDVAGLAIEPAAPTVRDDLRCVGEGVDLDDQPVTLAYAWDVAGAPAGEGDLLAAGSFVRGDTVTCAATPNDGRVDGTPASVSVVIGNAPPEVASLEITPNPATTVDALTCAGTGFDPDGDAVGLSFAWTVDGTDAGTGPALAAAAFRKAQTVTCTATPNDGIEDGAPSSVSIVIANTAPTAPGVAIEPEKPGVDDDLVCRVTGPSTDVDFDTVAYTVRWTVDGAAFTRATTTTITGDTVPAAETEDGQEWTCAVTPNDGEVDGPPGEATVTVVGAIDFVMFTTDAFLGSSSSTWLDDRDDADAKCESEADRLGIAGSDWRIVYSNPTEDARDFLLYDASRGDRVFDRHGTQIDGGDLFGSSTVRMPDMKSWTITGTGNDGRYRECSGSYSAGSWPICQYCERKFACGASTDDPFAPSACCWTGTRAIVCMGTKD
jgi:hypothetical protein